MQARIRTSGGSLISDMCHKKRLPLWSGEYLVTSPLGTVKRDGDSSAVYYQILVLLHEYRRGKDSGLTADELKDGIRKIFGYISRMKTGVNLQLGLKEVKEYSIRNAYDSVLETLRDTASPVIVYGNVDYVDGEGPDGADYGAAGGHYFMINSVMKLVADKGVTFRHNQKGYAHLVRVMNPIAHSDYYRNHDDMIRPSSNLWHYDDSITKQWRKSGSPWPFGDRHMYLANEVK